MMINITAMTTMCADIFDSTEEIFPGGEALNFAVATCGYPHINVGIMGAIGDDECGKAVLNSICGKSIDKSYIHIIKNGITASNRIYLTKEGDRYFKDDSWNSGVYGDFRMSDEDIEVLKRSDIVFINYYCPNFTDVLKLREMNSFKLAVDFDTTLAENGSVTFFNGKEYRVKAVPITEIVDTTGCGDSYHAAFICSYVKDNDIISAMNEDSAAASKTLSHIGGFL